jgi:hypothetical protein
MTQAPHEMARRHVEGALCSRTKLATYPYGGLGSRSDAGGTIHVGGVPSTFGASSPPLTSSCRAKGVTIERGQGEGSSTTIG